MPDLNLPELKRLDAEMYPAPWYAHEGGVTAGELRHGVGVVKIAAFRSELGSVDYYDAFAVVNSHGAVKLRNALPALIAIAEQVAELKRERDAIDELTTHPHGGRAEVRICSSCQTPYTDWGVSSFLDCHKCRFEHRHREQVAEKDKRIAELERREQQWQDALRSQAEACLEDSRDNPDPEVRSEGFGGHAVAVNVMHMMGLHLWATADDSAARGD